MDLRIICHCITWLVVFFCVPVHTGECDFRILSLCCIVPLRVASATPFIQFGQEDNVTRSWRTVNFDGTILNPVVFAVTATNSLESGANGVANGPTPNSAALAVQVRPPSFYGVVLGGPATVLSLSHG